VYQNSVHGNSLATLYSCVGDRSPLIILIEDTHRHLFGCFLTTPLKSQKKMSSFTGTGEVRTLQTPPFVTQLFQECCSVDPTMTFLCGTVVVSVLRPHCVQAFLFTLQPECEAYRWSGVNGYYVATSSESICIGCGYVSTILAVRGPT